MQLFRSITTLIAILMVMPWGAYSGAQASQARFQQNAATFVAEVDASLVAVTNDTKRDAQVLAPTPKRCRAAVLIGSACGPDVAISETRIALDPLVAINSVGRAAEVRLVGRVPSAPLDPPRSC